MTNQRGSISKINTPKGTTTAKKKQAYFLPLAILFVVTIFVLLFGSSSRGSKSSLVTSNLRTNEISNGIINKASSDDIILKVTLSNLNSEEGSKGDFYLMVKPSWAPLGAKQFLDLVKADFYNDCRFFRVLPKFVAQFGINGNPDVQRQWKKPILDDPSLPSVSNKRGTITFATSGKNTRTTQLFINYNDNKYLDSQGFTPFGEVMDNGMDIVDRIFAEYKEKPAQGKIQGLGNAYLKEQFPKLSFLEKIEIVES